MLHISAIVQEMDCRSSPSRALQLLQALIPISAHYSLATAPFPRPCAGRKVVVMNARNVSPQVNDPCGGRNGGRYEAEQSMRSSRGLGRSPAFAQVIGRAVRRRGWANLAAGHAAGAPVAPTGIPSARPQLATPGISPDCRHRRRVRCGEYEVFRRRQLPTSSVTSLFDGGGITETASAACAGAATATSVPAISPSRAGATGIPLGSPSHQCRTQPSADGARPDHSSTVSYVRRCLHRRPFRFRRALSRRVTTGARHLRSPQPV